MRFAVVRWVRLVKYFSKREASTAAACDDGLLLVKSSPHRSLDIAEIRGAGWQRQACRRLRRTGGEPDPFSAGSGGGNGIVVGRQSRRCSNWVQRNING